VLDWSLVLFVGCGVLLRVSGVVFTAHCVRFRPRSQAYRYTALGAQLYGLASSVSVACFGCLFIVRRHIARLPQYPGLVFVHPADHDLLALARNRGTGSRSLLAVVEMQTCTHVSFGFLLLAMSLRFRHQENNQDTLFNVYPAGKVVG
jgi:hypothetical protein